MANANDCRCFLEDVDPKFKETVYLPVLEYIADYLRKLQPTTYKGRHMASDDKFAISASSRGRVMPLSIWNGVEGLLLAVK